MRREARISPFSVSNPWRTKTGMEIEMAGKKLFFIYNPKAGKGQIRGNLLDILDIFVKAGYEVTVRPTQYAGEAVELAANRTAKYDLVVCSGGDGTLDEVVTGIMKSVRRRPIGYIPAGSTNDFADGYVCRS